MACCLATPAAHTIPYHNAYTSLASPWPAPCHARAHPNAPYTLPPTLLQHLPSYSFTEGVCEVLAAPLAAGALDGRELASLGFALAKLHCRPEPAWTEGFLAACQVCVWGGGRAWGGRGGGSCLLRCRRRRSAVGQAPCSGEQCSAGRCKAG